MFWVYPSKILALRLRQKGSTISTASNWICDLGFVMVTPPVINYIRWRTDIIFTVLNARTLLRIWKSLEGS
jgi:hypothetical protein